MIIAFCAQDGCEEYCFVLLMISSYPLITARGSSLAIFLPIPSL